MKADFPALWAESPSTLRREPTPTEFAGGFGCGPLDLPLFNELMFRLGQVYRESAYAITQSGQTPNANNTGQLWAAINRAGPQGKALWHTGVAAGTASALTVTGLYPSISAYTNEQAPCLIVVPFVPIAGATINVDGLGPIPIKRVDDTPIQTGDIVPGDMLGTIRAGAFRLLAFGRQEVPKIVSAPVLYVRTDGNDANDGSQNDAAHAFRTPAAAIRYGVTRFSFIGAELRIQLGNPGDYEAPGTVVGGTGTIVLQGDQNAQDNYVLNGGGSVGGILASGGALNCIGLTIRNPTSSASTFAAANNVSCALTNVTLICTNGSNIFSQVFVVNGANVTLASGCRFRGSMGSLFSVSGGAINLLPVQYALLDTPNYSVATCFIANSGSFYSTPGAVIQGNATGKRYLVAFNGTMDATGSGPNFFPGDVAGTTQTGGIYAL